MLQYDQRYLMPILDRLYIGWIIIACSPDVSVNLSYSLYRMIGAGVYS